MRKFLIVALLFSLAGCAFLKTQKDNASACLKDTDCFNEAITRSKDYGTKAGQVAGLSGLPYAEKVGNLAVGYGSLLVLLCVLGGVLNKKKVVVQ